MKFMGFSLQYKKRSKPLPAELVTALSRVEDALCRLAANTEQLNEWQKAIEANVKETRQRLETVYRKVYRDIAKEVEEISSVPTAAYKRDNTLPTRPGDPIEI